MNPREQLSEILEAILFAAQKPLRLNELKKLFPEELEITHQELKDALQCLQTNYEHRGIELREVASGFRFQVRSEFTPWVEPLFAEKPPRYSRALLETLALVAYRQPITRAEIEEIRGVGISHSIFKTLTEREWITIVGHREVPGRPALYATTKLFLDYFNLKNLNELPPLVEVAELGEAQEEAAAEALQALADPQDKRTESPAACEDEMLLENTEEETLA